MHRPIFYIGLMSGTSMDGVDAVLVDCAPMQHNQPPIIHAHHQLLPPPILKNQVQALMQQRAALTAAEWGALNLALGNWFTDSVLLLKQNIINNKNNNKNINWADIQAIGSHGQTVWHQPPDFTLQLGSAQTIATRVGCRVIADFRTRDMAYGGQGAPLVPAFHAAVWQSDLESRVILNLGGIANISYLPKKIHKTHHDLTEIMGFDTGPANALMDAWCAQHLGLPFDHNGDWARSGVCQEELVSQWLKDLYFEQAPPKSTGREYFNLTWLANHTPNLAQYLPQDIQASLLALSARSIARAIESCDQQQSAPAKRLIVCGGGSQNTALLDALAMALPQMEIETSEKSGLDSQHIEAAAFAWLAWQYDLRAPANVLRVTGASKPCLLGVEYLP